ncbi:hypothetical protein [Ornithinimicrobium murale]|uniref:hypothetical protein n=1 Tax=Ornithinimicrobium murale TaxID=1050153 RepID=UPI000E0D4808|nr:hypothetical protein [Ornithinimicrobium murale]
MDLLDYATRHLTPLGITVTQAWHRATATPCDDAYGTPRALDVLRRFHAKQLQSPVPTAHYAPVLPPTHPTTIAALDEGMVVVRHGGHETAAAHEHLLAHLTTCGIVEPHPVHRSLIVDTPQTLNLLGHLLTQATDDKAAACLDWWLQRADHAGTGATYVATTDVRKQWVTGEHPDAERTIETWRHWLNLPQASPPRPPSPSSSSPPTAPPSTGCSTATAPTPTPGTVSPATPAGTVPAATPGETLQSD